MKQSTICVIAAAAVTATVPTAVFGAEGVQNHKKATHKGKAVAAKSTAQRGKTAAAKKPAAKKATQKKNTRKRGKRGAKPDYTTDEIRGLQSQRSAMQKEIKKQEAALRANQADVKKRLLSLIHI